MLKFAIKQAIQIPFDAMYHKNNLTSVSNTIYGRFPRLKIKMVYAKRNTLYLMYVILSSQMCYDLNPLNKWSVPQTSDRYHKHAIAKLQSKPLRQDFARKYADLLYTSIQTNSQLSF